MLDSLGSASRNRFEDAAGKQMECIVADLGRMYQERNEALREVERAHHEALLRLSLAADFRDDDTGVHIIRIGFLAEALAQELGEPAAFCSMLRKAAPMHDVGKIGVSDEVLKKPGSFTAAERALMNKHPAMGAKILGRSRIPLFELAAEVALTHHERWDGTGYPLALSAEQIPLSGRIVAVVDYFDALTMDRCYRLAFPDDVALAMLMAQRGCAFDPRIVDAFVSAFGRMQAIRNRINDEHPSFEALMDAH